MWDVVRVGLVADVLLEALHTWQATHDLDVAVGQAAERGREFFLVHRVYRSHRSAEVVNARYTRPVFPTGWHHDVLRGLDHFQQAGASRDERLGDAIALLESRRRDDGTWRTCAHHPGRCWLNSNQEACRVGSTR